MNHNRGPSFETFFGKFLIDDHRALWFRYAWTHLQPDHMTLWGIFFDEGGTLVQQADFEKNKVVFSLKEHCALGKVGDVEWDLVFSASQKQFSPVPSWLGRMPFLKSHYASVEMDLEFSGSIAVAGQTYPLNRVQGMLGHVWGQKLPVSWVWGHCNTFENARGVVFEGLASRVRVGGIALPAQTAFVFEVDGMRYEFSSLSVFSRAHSESAGDSWKFYGKNCRVEVSGEIVLPRNNLVAQLQLPDTDGSHRTNRSSALCDLVVRLKDRKTKETREFIARGTAMFEIVK